MQSLIGAFAIVTNSKKNLTRVERLSSLRKVFPVRTVDGTISGKDCGAFLDGVRFFNENVE